MKIETLLVVAAIFLGIGFVKMISAQECNHADEVTIATCLRPMFAISERIAKIKPELNFILFPLLVFSENELNLLCQNYRQSLDGCMPFDLADRCKFDNKLMMIMTSLFDYPCSTRRAELDRNLNCMRRVSQRSPHCLSLVTIQNPPRNGREPDKCSAVPGYYRCLSPGVFRECGQEAVEVLEMALVKFGCALGVEKVTIPTTEDPLRKIVIKEKETKTTTEWTTEVPTTFFEEIDTTTEWPDYIESTTEQIDYPDETTEPDDLPRIETLEPITEEDHVKINQIAQSADKFDNSDNSPVDPTTLSESLPRCNETNKFAVRTCLQPVLNIWQKYLIAIKGIVNTTYPLFRLGRENLLNLCDEYATAFLKCRLETFLTCREDAVVHFADSLLGYACGNAAQFFPKYNCIANVADAETHCTPLIENTTKSGDICLGLPEYFECVRNSVYDLCGEEASVIMERSITYFGCAL